MNTNKNIFNKKLNEDLFMTEQTLLWIRTSTPFEAPFKPISPI